MDWILVQCDLNKDIGINIIEQLSIPNLSYVSMIGFLDYMSKVSWELML